MDAFEVISKAHQVCCGHNLLTALDKSYLETLRDSLEHDYGKGAQLKKQVLLIAVAQKIDLQRFDQDKLRKLNNELGGADKAIMYLAGATIYLMDNFELIEDRGVFVK